MVFILLLFGLTLFGIFLFRQKDRSIKIPVLLCVIFILFAGLRSNYGNDFNNYLINWQEINNISDLIHSEFDKGYVFLVFIFKNINIGFHSFLLFIAFVSIFLKYKLVNELSPIPIISWMIYYLIFFIINDMEQIRHGLAIGICLYSIVYLISNKKIKYFGSCILAALIHSSAILFFPIYFFRNCKLTIKKAAIILAASILVSQINFMYLLTWLNNVLLHNDRIANKVLLYSDNTVEGPLSITFMLRIFIFILYFYIAYDPNNLKSRIFLNGYFYGIVVFLVFNSISIVAVRSSAIFRCFEIIMIAEIVDKIVKKQLDSSKMLFAFKGSKRKDGDASRAMNLNIERLNYYVAYFSVLIIFSYYFYRFFSILFSYNYFNYLSI